MPERGASRKLQIADGGIRSSLAFARGSRARGCVPFVQHHPETSTPEVVFGLPVHEGSVIFGARRRGAPEVARFGVVRRNSRIRCGSGEGAKMLSSVPGDISFGYGGPAQLFSKLRRRPADPITSAKMTSAEMTSGAMTGAGRTAAIRDSSTRHCGNVCVCSYLRPTRSRPCLLI